ncbi:hypothetical protein D9611_013364 [Ephemerocybe angulata]|uniref:F-box domain-containing protein n=1 Tax=Ephemerocybe angulata TaxID=980116 RepID=A0A8H5CBF0_9AGAR|nr:hypothetical protein D9611_013364 [Tulosesus angulatus]
MASTHDSAILSPAPMSRFPIEILTEIFLALTIEAFLEPHSNFEVPELPSRVPSQVCSEWRRVLLNYPPYWTKIVLGGFSQKEWFDELAKRSKGRPLDVRVYSDPYHPTHVRREQPVTNLDHAMHRISQIRSLEVYANFSELQVAFVRLRHPVKAPFLESLVVEKYPYSMSPARMEDMEISRQELRKLPKKAGRISAPLLRHLKSHCYSRVLLLGPFRGLRKVEITDTRYLEILTHNELLESLSGLPELEELICKAELSGPENSSGEHVSLPRLKHLTLWTSAEPFHIVLSAIEAHPSCIFNFHISQLLLCEDHDCINIGRAIGEKTKKWADIQLVSGTIVDIQLKDPNVLYVYPNPRTEQSSFLRLSLGREEYLRWDPIHHCPYQISDILQSIIRNVGTPTKVRICRNGWNLGPPMLGLLNTLGSVTDLSLHDIKGDMMSCLSIPGIFPNLEVLRISGDTTEEALQVETPRGVELQRLVDTLKERKRSPCRLALIDLAGLDPSNPLYLDTMESATGLEKLGLKLDFADKVSRGTANVWNNTL